MEMHLRIWNRLLLDGMVAAEIESSSPDTRAWVAVIANIDQTPGRPPRRLPGYRVLRIEIDRAAAESDCDNITDETIREWTVTVVQTREEIEQLLASWTIDAGTLIEPWKLEHFPL